ncbi:unnamed protein product [Allacma fusca]|uniref:Uncharacterized protein n=1 Tax=Allacma fusca TaxID=39272 RepID=A0A8J2KHD3_9HEXA|nr:unnamed protein product [Allacma fusca]
MYPKAREAILKHRVTLLKLASQDKLNYLIVSSPLYEKQLLPRKKHVEIRDGRPSNIERLESLLEWVEDVVHKPEILDALVDGIKKSDNILLARKLKKDAKGDGEEPKGGESAPLDGRSNVVIKTEKKPKKAREPKLKLPKVVSAPPVPVSAESTTPKRVSNVNGVKRVGTPKSAKKNKDATPATNNAGPSGNRRNSKLPDVSNTFATKTKSLADGVESGDLKVLSPVPSHSRKRKSEAASEPVFNPQLSMWGYFKKENLPKSETTLEAANKKLESASRAFTFRNDSVTLSGFRADKLFYEGCGHPVQQFGFCSKKVTKKGDRYMCSSKHETEAPLKVPRLQLTLKDPSGELDVTMWKTSVEILAGKGTLDLEKLNDQDLKQLFTSSIGKKFSVYVETEKVSKRDLKKTNGRLWNLNATIIAEDNSPAAKKRG